jgi:hypothetical protein
MNASLPLLVSPLCDLFHSEDPQQADHLEPVDWGCFLLPPLLVEESEDAPFHLAATRNQTSNGQHRSPFRWTGRTRHRRGQSLGRRTRPRPRASRSCGSVRFAVPTRGDIQRRLIQPRTKGGEGRGLVTNPGPFHRSVGAARRGAMRFPVSPPSRTRGCAAPRVEWTPG